MIQVEPRATEWKSHWERVSNLGGGGQGTTVIVRPTSEPGLNAVLKLLQRPKDPESRRRMAREAVNLRAVKNAGGSVPSVIDGNTEQFESPGVEIYFVMELIDGTTLAKYLKQEGPRPVDEAIVI